MRKFSYFIIKAILLAFFYSYQLIAQTEIIDLQTQAADVTIIGSQDDIHMGSGLAVADINGDGFNDILVGASQSADDSSQQGHVYIIYGKEQYMPQIDLDQIQADVTIIGSDSMGKFGINIHTRDFNQDNIDDMLIAEPLASPKGRLNAGVIYLFWGKSEFSPMIDLQQDIADITIIGAKEGDHFGTSLASGDVNGDGLIDILVGAEGAYIGQRVSCGATFIIFNYPEFETNRTIDCKLDFHGFTVYGLDNNDLSARSIISDDINADGFDDIIIGAHKADSPLPNVTFDAGEVYILWGKSGFPYIVDLSEISPDVTIIGCERQCWFGYSLYTADIDRDGYADLAVSAPRMNCHNKIDAGKVYLFLGKNLLNLNTIDLSVESADLEITGAEYYANLGWSISTGNFNANDIPDLVLGAPQSSPFERKAAGVTFILFDVANYDSLFDLGDQRADIMIAGEAPSGFLATSLYVTNLDNNGLDDLLLSAPSFELKSKVYCLFNSTLTAVTSINPIHIRPEQFEIYQNYPNPFSGYGKLPSGNKIGTTIRYDVFTPANISFKIYNINGEEIANLLHNRIHIPGSYSISWDGRNSSGTVVASGIYFVSIASEKKIKWKRIVLVR